MKEEFETIEIVKTVEHYASVHDTTFTKIRANRTLGLGTPALSGNKPIRKLFITINISPKQRVRFNKKVFKKWGDYKTLEQSKILSRYRYYLESISKEFTIYFEYTKDVNIHIHCICKTGELEKDIKIDTKRFFSVPDDNRYLTDIKPITDEAHLIEYLTKKDQKGYQTTGILPYIHINEAEL